MPLLAQNQVAKQILSGAWLGNLEAAGGVNLRIVYNIKINDRDSLVASMDSPDQGASNIPMGRVIARNDSLIILAPLLMGNYKGSIKGDTLIEGTWTQRGNKYPMDIRKMRKPITSVRPQEPRPPFPYSSEDVTFPNAKFNISLAGTLTVPAGNGPFPAVIMITGSGAQNRDEAIMGHKPFLVIADWLSRNGVAVLRYDDRGVGKSQGNYGNATSADLATDAESAYLYLKNNSKINPGAIGLIGHSEGGLIAPIVSSGNPGIAFIVSLSGPGVNGEQIVLRQAADIGRLSGLSEEKIKESNETNQKLYAVIKNEKDDFKAEAKVMDTYRKILTDQKLTPDQVEEGVSKLQGSFGASVYPWFRYFLLTEPADFWKKVKCPVLALNGEKDIQVAAEVNLPAIEKALKSSGNINIKTVKLPGLNHLFQHCTTGLPSEYNKIEETFSPDALKIISDWILGLKVSR
jgi:alpha/beta superfamily hydrolase